MLALILAAVLSSAPATHVEDTILTAIFAAQGARAERARLASWLDEQDATRRQAIERQDRRVNPFADDAKVSPFASDDLKPNPFDGPPRLFWWTPTSPGGEQ